MPVATMFLSLCILEIGYPLAKIKIVTIWMTKVVCIKEWTSVTGRKVWSVRF